MTLRLFAALVLVTACAGQETPPPDEAAPVNEDSIDAAVAMDTVLPPMPAHPSGEGGKLAVSALGALTFNRSWPARAGRCARPALVLLIGDQPGSGGSVLLRLPTSGTRTGTYPVKLADSTGVPEPPAAQLGFQFFEGTTSDAYQAADGSVEVTTLTDRRIDGRFAVTVRHLATNRRAQIAGVFEDVAVEALPPDWCERAAAAQDSLKAGGT